MTPTVWRLAKRTVDLDPPRVMAVLNATPDSFSDGGELGSVEAGVDRAARAIEEGAFFLDVGGESTRPGAAAVSVDEECARVVPLIDALSRRFESPISVDTRKSRVASAAIDAGAEIINDVSALAYDPEMVAVARGTRAGLVLMHMRGEPHTMRDHADYYDVTTDVARELGESLDRAGSSGVAREAVVLDPGIGFAKTAEQSLALVGGLEPLIRLGRPLLVGPSRKSFLGELLGVPPKGRVAGTAAACVVAYLQGARIFRVHDVAPVAQALKVAGAAVKASTGGRGGPSIAEGPETVTMTERG